MYLFLFPDKHTKRTRAVPSKGRILNHYLLRRLGADIVNGLVTIVLFVYTRSHQILRQTLIVSLPI